MPENTLPEHYDVKDLSLADAGLARIMWADRDMPVLAKIRERFAEERPLEGVRIGACMHVTTETANLMRVLVAGGADVTLCASNPLSTQDDTAASLVRDFGIKVHAITGEDMETYEKHIAAVCEPRIPQIIMDDGADLDTAPAHDVRRQARQHVIGGTEETTTGVVRLAAMAKPRARCATRCSTSTTPTPSTASTTTTAPARARSTASCAPPTACCAAAPWSCPATGTAAAAWRCAPPGMGMNVIVCEVDPLKALEAHMEGYRVMKAEDAARYADVWVTVTGDCKVIDEPAFKNMKDGAILCNSGHFDSEINLVWLEEHCVKKEEIKPLVEEYTLEDGRTIIVLAQGRLVNLSCAEGHPASVMDMSFANQALAAEYLYKHQGELECKVYDVPADIDDGVARVKLETLGIEIDELTEEQIAYMNSWKF